MQLKKILEIILIEMSNIFLINIFFFNCFIKIMMINGQKLQNQLLFSNITER